MATKAIWFDDEELRSITGFAAHCARQVLPIIEDDRPGDRRCRVAIKQAQVYADGSPRTAALRSSAWAAFASAREATSPAAVDAARAAGHAAAAAFLHPLAQSHQVKHIVGSAAHAARAHELAAGDDPQVAALWLDATRRMAPPHLIDVLSRFPPAPAGGGRVGDLMRALDTALRSG